MQIRKKYVLRKNVGQNKENARNPPFENMP